MIAAIALIDRVGPSELIMPSLATALGVPPAVLGDLFDSSDDLLDAVVDEVVDELFAALERQALSGDWREHLLRMAHGVRRIALTHPLLFPLIVTRPSAAEWLQPPLRSLRWTEAFLETLHRHGFSERAAASAYRTFSTCMLGHLLMEVADHHDGNRPVDTARRSGLNTELLRYPRLANVQQELARDCAQDEFEDALDLLLERLNPRHPRH